MHSLFHWLIDEELLVKDPSRKIRERGDIIRVPKALTPERFEDLREACLTPREHVVLEMFFATGARLAELAGMRRDKIDWQARAVTIIGKGNKEREVYFGVKAAIWLTRYFATRTDDLPFVLVTERQPYRPLSKHALYGQVKKIAIRAGMGDRVTPHALRHTFATMMLNNGADITVIQSLLGHSKIATTQVYTTLSGRRRRQEYDRFFSQ